MYIYSKAKYDIDSPMIYHVPGKDLIVADMLHRAPVGIYSYNGGTIFPQRRKCDVVMQSLPATDSMLDTIKEEQEQDEVCRQIKVYCHNSWPE